jgi:hypothetical protein
VHAADAQGLPATTVRRLLADSADGAAIAREMSDNQPDGGVARGRLPEGELPAKRRLLEGTYRLLDSEILLAAARCLDQDVAIPVAAWLKSFRELRAAATRTLADPAARETVVLDVRRTLTAPQDVAVHMYVDRKRIATFPFRLLLTAELGRTAVLVREGAVHQVDCVAASLKARITFADVPKPLWQRTARDLALHLPLPEPLRIPLVKVPTPRSDEAGVDHPMAAT